MKKSLIVLGALSVFALMFTGCPKGTDSPKNPVSDPAGNETPSDPETPVTQQVTAYNAKDIARFWYKLDSEVESGTEITVNVKGTNNGTSGFRIYAIKDDTDKNLSGIDKFTAAEGLPEAGEEFEHEAKITTTDAANMIQFKGPSYGVNIDDIIFSEISVTINGNTKTFDPANDVKK